MRVFAALLLLLPATALAQWQLQDSHTTASLRGIHSIGNGVAWASGTDGTVLRTVDQGKTWQPCTIPPGADKLDFRGIQAFNANTAIVMSSGKGDLSRLYETSDACNTWKLVFTNPDAEGFWDSLAFDFTSPSPSYGVLIGDPVKSFFDIWETRDAGHTWTKWNTGDQKHQPHSQKGEALFAAGNRALSVPGSYGAFSFVTGGEVSRFCSEQGYGHFSLLDSPYDGYELNCVSLHFQSSKSGGAFALAMRPSIHGVKDVMIVGGDYSLAESATFSIYLPRYGDGPIFAPHKLERSTVGPHGYRSSVAYDEFNKTWITVGPNGTDASDDGKNWHPLTPSPTGTPDEDTNWNALSLPFVVGPKGRIGLLRPEALLPTTN